MNKTQLRKLITNSKVAHLNKKLLQEKIKGNISVPKRNNSPQKDWLAFNIAMWCNEKALTLRTEYYFHPTRRWRFDFEIESLMVAIEYNGIMSEKSRHTTISGYSGDMDKLNAAQQLGYTVFQYTPLNYKNVLRDMDQRLLYYTRNLHNK